MTDQHPILICPACRAANRVDPARADAAACGKCGAPVFEPAPIALTAADFDRHIARTGVPLLVDFWAPWCGPCKMMAPQFAEAARLLHPSVRLAKVDTQAEQALGGRFGVQSIPTMLLFKDGREAGRVSGAMNARDITAWAERALA